VRTVEVLAGAPFGEDHHPLNLKTAANREVSCYLDFLQNVLCALYVTVLAVLVSDRAAAALEVVMMTG
jgi:hypothetical protein